MSKNVSECHSLKVTVELPYRVETGVRIKHARQFKNVVETLACTERHDMKCMGYS